MEMTGRVALGIIGSLSLLIGATHLVDAAPAVSPVQSYSEIEQAELRSRIAEASGLPSVVPENPKALLGYLRGAELLLSQLQRHRAYLRLRASRDMDDRAAADAGDQIDAAMDRLLVNDSMSILQAQVQTLAETYKKSDSKH
jgi:hypothetical protein